MEPTKKEIISALGLTTREMCEKRDVLLNKMSQFKDQAVRQINELCAGGLIDPADWGISFIRLRGDDYVTYNGGVIDKTRGGDVPTNYSSLISFCINAGEIIKGMQAELKHAIEVMNEISWPNEVWP